MSVGGVGNMMNDYFAMTNSISQSSALSGVYDYKAAQQQTKSLLDTYQQNKTSISALKKDTSDFLTTYTNTMNGLQSSAAKLTNGGINDILFDSEGKTSEKSIQDTVSAVKDMVGQYNKTLDFLNTNAERGPGVVNQIARMAADPAAKQKLDIAGISVNKDGTLALDEAKLTSALSNPNTLQVNLVADAIGDWNGIAGGVAQDARAGLNTAAGKLVSNDIASMQEMKDNDPIQQMYSSMKAGGAFYFNNMAAGLMMNMLA